MAEFEAPPGGDSHNWNSLDNYRFLHEKHLAQHPLVLPEGWSLDIDVTDCPALPYDYIKLGGLVVCANGLVLEITKTGDLDRTPAHKVPCRASATTPTSLANTMSYGTTTCMLTNPTSTTATYSTPKPVTKYPSGL